jgi:hypothetical protein
MKTKKVMAIKIINIIDLANTQHWVDELVHAMQSNGPLHQVICKRMKCTIFQVLSEYIFKFG